jgi:hypothetical protein
LVLLFFSGASSAVRAQEQQVQAPPNQAQESPRFGITGVDLADLPLVHVTASGSGLGAPLAQLPAVIREDRIEQTIVQSETVDIGIASAFLVDASSNIVEPGNTGDARNVEIANAVNRFVQMQLLAAETDWLAAYTFGADGQGFQQLADWNPDHQLVANALQQYEPVQLSDSTPLFTLIKYGLDQVEIGPFPGNLRRSLVVFSDGYDKLSALQIDDIVNRANRLGVTVHTVMVGPPAEDRQQNLQRIADATGGRYVLYNSLEDMERLWQRLAEDRRQQRYTYRLTKAQPELLEMAVTSTDGSIFDDEYTVPFVPLQPPQLTVVEPQLNAAIERHGAASDTAPADLQPGTLNITLDVQWPDGHPRNFERIEYEIGGQTLVPSEEPFTSVAFPLADLGEGPQTLRVLAVDEFGIESKSAPQSFRISFVLPTPEPPPTPTAVAASAPAPAADSSGGQEVATEQGAQELAASAPAATKVVPLAAAPVAASAAIPAPDTSFDLGGMPFIYGSDGQGGRQLTVGTTVIPVNPLTLAAAALPLLLLIGVLAFTGRKSRKPKAPTFGTPSGYDSSTLVDNKSTMIEATAYDVTEDATEAQPIVQFEAPASLVYIEGGEHLPKKLDIEGGREVRIGRKQTYCDVLIDDQRVSRLHASIHEREDGNFYLKDEGSSGGTFVNRRKLRVNDAHLLKHGDVINFNTVAYRFELADEASDQAAGLISGQAPPQSTSRSSGNGMANSGGGTSGLAASSKSGSSYNQGEDPT